MFAASGSAQLAYDDSGPAEGQELLLIHAGVNDRRSWRHVVECLAPRHRCVAYDMRGFGETRYEHETGWTPAGDALAVLDAAAIERAVLVACSMGGEAAIDLALAHPERVAGLALIGSAIRGAPYPELDQGPTFELNERFAAAEEAGDLAELEQLDAWMWLDGPTTPGRVQGPARELFLEMNAIALRAEDPGEQGETEPAWPRLGELAMPVVVMVGTLDAEEIQTVDPQAAALIPGAQLVRLEGVAHVPHLEGDAATLAQIERFVEGI